MKAIKVLRTPQGGRKREKKTLMEIEEELEKSGFDYEDAPKSEEAKTPWETIQLETQSRSELFSNFWPLDGDSLKSKHWEIRNKHPILLEEKKQQFVVSTTGLSEKLLPEIFIWML